MQKHYRSGRLGEEIKKIVSELLRKELKDPGIAQITSVTGVDVTSDGSYATVYLSVLASKEEKQTTVQALNKAAGFIRGRIGKRVAIRHVPELTFKLDTSLDYGMHIEKILEGLHEEGQSSEADTVESGEKHHDGK